MNDLTPPQRSWLFETFGHYGENDELQQVAHYQPGERRYSDVQQQRDPYQYQHPRELDDGPDNRNSIFRRGGRPPTVPQENPISWSPTGERPDLHHFDSRGFHVRPPFHRSNSLAVPPEDLNLKRHSEAGGKMAPIYPHMEEKLTWQQSFENLQIYKRTYGDCNVPQKYKLNVKLGGWVVSNFSNTF